MTPTMLVRELTADDRQALRRGLKSADGFTARRSQVLLATGAAVGLPAQAVRNAIRAFHADGLGGLAREPPVARTPAAVWDRGRAGDLKALPHVSPRAAGDPLRRRANARDPKGGGPEAVAGYGVLRADTGGMMLRFCGGRPVSATTEGFLGWVCRELAAEGKTVLALVWDNAAWHVSQRVAAWVAGHNGRVARGGGCRIEVCHLPAKAPWLNRIEPKWVHGERAVAEPDRKLSADEVRQRVCDYFGCQPEPLMAKPAT